MNHFGLSWMKLSSQSWNHRPGWLEFVRTRARYNKPSISYFVPGQVIARWSRARAHADDWQTTAMESLQQMSSCDCNRLEFDYSIPSSSRNVECHSSFFAAPGHWLMNEPHIIRLWSQIIAQQFEYLSFVTTIIGAELLQQTTRISESYSRSRIIFSTPTRFHANHDRSTS